MTGTAWMSVLPPESLAVLAAATWAGASLFSATASARMGALAFTRWRMVFAALLLGGHCAGHGLLVLSGVIGIFVGDTALFACMNRLGPRRACILFATHALFSALLAALFLGESITGWALLGSAMLVSGVMAAIAFGKREDEAHHWEATRGRLAVGMPLILKALQHGSAGLVGMLSSVTPVILLPLLWWRLGRRPAAGAWWGAALAVAGCALILGRA